MKANCYSFESAGGFDILKLLKENIASAEVNVVPTTIFYRAARAVRTVGVVDAVCTIGNAVSAGAVLKICLDEVVEAVKESTVFCTVSDVLAKVNVASAVEALSVVETAREERPAEQLCSSSFCFGNEDASKRRILFALQATRFVCLVSQGQNEMRYVHKLFKV